jgi:hypothetical protein
MSSATFSADVKSPSLLIIRMRAYKRIHSDQGSLLGHVVESSINRVELKVSYFLEEFGVGCSRFATSSRCIL